MENKEIIMRIKMLIEKKKVSPSGFAKLIGFNQSNFSKILRGEREVPTNLINAICGNLNISYLWLVNGDGSISEDTQDRQEQPEISYTKGKPYYNVDFIGGFDLVMNDQTSNPDYLIDFQKYQEADCWCNITGHSMEPLISSGDIIALKEMKDWRDFLLFGEVYGIITDDMRTVKTVTKSQKGEDFLQLVPENKAEEYQPQDIPIKLIRKVFKVLGCMKKL